VISKKNILREAVLGRKRSKSKANRSKVAVCFDSGQIGVAEVKYSQTGKPALELSVSVPLNSTDDQADVLGQLARQHQLQKKSCVNVLPSDSYQLIQAEIGELSASEKREAARWQIRERIDYPPEEAVVDLFEIPSFSGDRKPLTYVVSAQKSILQKQVQLIDHCDLDLDSIDIPEFSLRNICDLYAEDPRGLAILLLLNEKGILVIAREGRLYLVRLFNTGMDDLLPYAEGDYEALTDQLDAIVLEIQRSFDFCESTFLLPTVSRLLVAQTEQEIPAVVSYLNEYLATQVEAFRFPGNLSLPDGVDQLDLNRNLLAIGGALRQESN
jgi:MSHA biogenesis protein MshI